MALSAHAVIGTWWRRVCSSRAVRGADRRSNLQRLARLDDELLEQHVLTEVEPGGAKRLAIKPGRASARRTSSVATAAPLEKSMMEWAEAKSTAATDGIERSSGRIGDRSQWVVRSWHSRGEWIK